MNDFTKEELKTLSYSLWCLGNKLSCIRPNDEQKKEINKISELLNKVDDYIANYCEHKKEKVLDKTGMFVRIKCNNCGKKFYE